jgi:drug/metabolite transporter (DMT)-like permease
MNPSIRGVFWMAGAALCFSVSIGLVRQLSESMSTFEIVFLRQLLGAVVMLPWLWRAGFGALRTQVLPLHGIRAAFGYLGMVASYYSVTLIPLADAVSLQFTSPLWVAVMAIFFLGETIRSNRWIAIALGFAGVLVIMRPGFEAIGIGMLIALAAALFYAGGDVTVRALSRTDSIPVIMFYGYILQLPFAIIPAAMTWTTPGWDVAPAFMAFLVVAVGAQWCMTSALSIADASLVTPVLFLRLPLVAAIGYFFFAQIPDTWTWIGAAIILTSTYVLSRWEGRDKAARRKPG